MLQLGSSLFTCKVVLFSLILTQYNVIGGKRRIPDFVILCSLSSSQEDSQKCFNENLAAFKPLLAAGIPEMRIPGLDPLLLESVIMAAANFRAEFINVTITGASKFDVLNATFDAKKLVLSMRVLFPFVHVEGNYKIDGKLLVFQLKSLGNTWLNASNIDASIEMRGKLREEKGKSFGDFNDQTTNTIKLTIKDKPSLYYYNLFDGNEELTKTTNDVLNDNIVDIMQELMPLVDKIIGSFVFNAVQTVFNTFPIEELFLP